MRGVSLLVAEGCVFEVDSCDVDSCEVKLL